MVKKKHWGIGDYHWPRCQWASTVERDWSFARRKADVTCKNCLRILKARGKK